MEDKDIRLSEEEYRLKELEDQILGKDILKKVDQALAPVPTDKIVTNTHPEVDFKLVSNEKQLKKVLGQEDFAYYCEKMNLYLMAYPDLIDPFDIDDMDLMIKEQIFRSNLLKKKAKFPSINISKEYDDSVNRTDQIKKSLGIRRVDRMKKGGGRKVVNISSMSVNMTDQDQVNRMEQELAKLKAEEAQLRNSPNIIE